MTDLLDRVLLPVASTEDAAATAAALEGYDIGEIVAVHVIEKAGGAPDKAGVQQREEEAVEIFRVLRESLDQPIETEITYGTDVAETIFDAAHEIDASSIVITPRGGSRWIRLLTGDVALSLITESDLPVVVLPDDEAAEADESDGSEAVEDE
jgi:nucleotide-binding universal stress UspA family protein